MCVQNLFVWRSKDSWQLVLFHLYVVPGVELRLLGLAASTYTHQAIIAAHQHFFIECMFQAWFEACHLLCWPLYVNLTQARVT